MHAAALAGRASVMEVLLQQRHSQLNDATRAGNTPLHLAAMSGSADVVRLLLQFCANTELRNDELRTPREMDGLSIGVIQLLDRTDRSPGRCQCECGSFAAPAGHLVQHWTEYCVAEVKCELDVFRQWSAVAKISCAVKNATANKS